MGYPCYLEIELAQVCISKNERRIERCDFVDKGCRFTQRFCHMISGNHAANDGELVRRWCIAGKGIAVKSCLDMSSDLLSGNVINIMPNFKPTSTELWLICPSRQSITPAVRLFRDMFKEKTKDILNQLVKKVF